MKKAVHVKEVLLKAVHVIITAAGSSERFKKGPGKNLKPKQFINLLGKPVILHSLIKFQKCKEVKSIIISSAPEYFNFIHSMASKHKITKLKALIEGGNTRFESVRNSFNQINCPNGLLRCRLDDIILIHDAARPNITTAEIKNLIGLAYKDGEVILGSRVSDTVKRDNGGVVTDTLSRDNLWLTQTPQAFRYDVLSRSYIIAGNKTDFTDESSMVEYAGYKVKITEGSKYNIKITNSEDLKTLKKLMS